MSNQDLFENGANINSKDQYPWSPLHWTLEKMHV